MEMILALAFANWYLKNLKLNIKIKMNV
jgi:hypothetical protein